MMRVNLLPPEILQRRQAERRIGWVVIGAIAIAVVLAGVWAFAQYQLQSRQDQLATIQQQTQAVQAQADQLAIFETRAGELATRQASVQAALGDRFDWARILDEVSLVLPADMWLQTLTANETSGLSMAGYAIDAPNDSPDQGHKTIAKGLVRLAELDSLYDVWLSTSTRSIFLEQPVIQFTITTKVKAVPAQGGAQ